MTQSLLILSFSDISADARVLKQVAAFRDRYEVTTCGYGPAPEGVADHVQLPSDQEVWRYSRALLMLRQYARAYRQNGAVRAASAALVGRRFDVVLANDVDAVPLALSLRPRLGVHADLHEFAPAQKTELLRWRLFVAPFMAWICRTSVTRATSVTTVAHGIAREYRRRFGIAAGVVTNATPFADQPPTELHAPIALVHSGACFRNRHLDIMLDALELTSRPATLDLYLTPNDPAYLDELVERARTRPNVRVHDPVPYRELVRTLHDYDVGVFVLPPVNVNYRWALPNKLFDFVQARLGVVVGPSPEMAELVRQEGFGVVADDFTAAGLARVLDTLTPEAVEGLKQRSDQVAAPLSSETQVAIWVAAVDRIAAGG